MNHRFNDLTFGDWLGFQHGSQNPYQIIPIKQYKQKSICLLTLKNIKMNIIYITLSNISSNLRHVLVCSC